MKYTITINCQGGRQNHLSNPMLKLDNCEYRTREEACDAIYTALEDVIQGDGCEMIERVCPKNDDWEVCDDERFGGVARLYRSGDVPTQRQFAIDAGFDDPNSLPNELLPTQSLDDYLWDLYDKNPDNLVSVDEAGDEVVAKALKERDAYRDYESTVYDYIVREGYATEDGVSATVTEVCDGIGGTLFTCDDQGNNSEPVCVTDEPMPEDDCIAACNSNLGDGLHVRPATVDDDVDASVDYVLEDANGNVCGYYKFVLAD